MEHFVTLFDSFFLPQGLALFESLQQHCSDFTLWVLCLDDELEQALLKLNLPSLCLLSLSDLETTHLKELRHQRTRAEYCWTLTPWSIHWVFCQSPSATRVTYIDADAFFFQNPKPLLEEFGASKKGVLITEHAYAPECDGAALSGRYCVQFITFSVSTGLEILSWWKDQCMAWCFNRFENGLFGDQKYLESFEKLWPEQVFSVGREGQFQAPWNASIFRPSEALMFHFHGLRVIDNDHCLLTDYSIPQTTLSQIYRPYVQLIFNFCPRLLPSIPRQSNNHLSWLSGLKLRFRKTIVLKLSHQLIPPYYGVVSRGKVTIW